MEDIAANDPATKTSGEDAHLSELECSEEEEGSCDPDNECASLIDLWYGTHTHFPVVPGDYLPLPPGRMCLSIF